jgi:hypothetical protein
MKIVVHDGRAHTDDFLAACVCYYKLGFDVFRQGFSAEMLENPDIWVLDQGRIFNPDLHNFDHHQIEKELCAFTMVLDYFYSDINYREFMPNLQFIEIFDSYGPIRAADFVGIKPDNLELVSSPIQSALLKSFSKIQGQVQEPFLPIMKLIGGEICKKIEDVQILDKCLDSSKVFDFMEIKVLDTTGCPVPKGYEHDQLPTKSWCKKNKINPVVILTRDTRQNGFRMVSINTNTLKFSHCDKAYFTHNSGFLVGFKEYSDYAYILANHVSRS